MKNIILFFIFGYGSLFFAQRSHAQCYERMEDASGFNTNAYQDTLQAAAAKLCAILDTMGFAGQFKVYDFGFYLHQENTTGGYPEPFAQKITEVQDSSPYYLLFGKQTDKNGIYTKFWIALKMPDTAQFSCMTPLQREVYGKRVEKRTTDKYAEKNNNYDAFSEAEVAGIDEFYKILREIKECCLYRDGNRMMSCIGCDDEIINTYFDISGFKKIDLPTAPAAFASIKKNSIKDYSFHKVALNGEEDYIGNHLDTLVDNFNTWFSFNLLITSNPSLCIDSISGNNLNNFKTEKEFFCHLNLSSELSENSRVDIRWNKKPNSWIKNNEIANLVIDVLYCKINRELNISNEDCFPYLSVPPWIANMDDFPDFDLFYAIYLHNLNTGVNVIDLLEGYNEFGGSEVVADPDPEINNGIEIVSTSVAFLVPTTGTLIGESPARGNIEDIQHGNNGDCTGVIYNCMTYIPPACPQCPGNDLTDNELQGMMHGLMTFFSKPPLENIAISFAQRFFDKNSSDHYSTDLSEHVRNSTNMRNYMKLFGEQLNDKLKTNGGNIYLGAPIPMTVRPAFGGWHNRWHGLTILINDTEETTIWYIGNFNLDNDTKVWSGDFYFEVTDHFGLDKPDVIKFQGYHSGFAAWWALQHKKNYPPFKTKITIFATLKGQL